MLCDRILGNMEEGSLGNISRTEDALELHWWECWKRALRKQTAGGRDVRVLLPIGKALQHGDVVYDDGDTRIVVRVLPCEVLVVRPWDLEEMGVLMLELGNLHAPAEVSAGDVLVAADGPVEAVLVDLGLPFEAETRRFAPRRCVGMPAFEPAAEFAAARA
jgi:urease accessory protein